MNNIPKGISAVLSGNDILLRVQEGHNEPLESLALLQKYHSLLHYIELIEVWSVDPKRSVTDDAWWSSTS
jgi:hypothetical protein